MMKEERLRSMDLNLLVTLDALVRRGSVTAAAEELGVTQSAVSHGLSRLRTHLADPLCVRSAGKLQWTPRGQAAHASAARILAAIHGELLAPVKFDPESTTSTFSLCLSEVSEYLFLEGFTKAFRECAPGARLRVLPVTPRLIAEMLESGQVNLALGGMLSAMPASLRQLRMIEYGWVVIASAAQPSSERKMSRADYVRRAHVIVSRDGSFNDFIEPHLGGLGIRRWTVLSLAHYVNAVRLVASSDMIATVPDFVAHRMAESFPIRVLQVTFRLPRVISRMYWHERFHHDEANKWLRGLVAEHFSFQNASSAA